MKTAEQVKPGEVIYLKECYKTPGRKIYPKLEPGPYQVKAIIKEQGGFVHFDLGLILPEGEEPLSSLNTGEILDQSNTYWLHSNRFEFY